MTVHRLIRYIGWAVLSATTVSAVYLGVEWAAGRRAAVIAAVGLLGLILIVAGEDSVEDAPGADDLDQSDEQVIQEEVDDG